MIVKANRATLVLFVASVLMLVLAAVLVSQPLSRAAAQQDDDGPKDMQELCVFLAGHDSAIGITFNQAIDPNIIYYDFSPDDIFWCGEDFMCFDRPFRGDGDFCLPYSGVVQIFLPGGAFGE